MLVKFLGHVIDQSSVAVDPAKVEVISDFWRSDFWRWHFLGLSLRLLSFSFLKDHPVPAKSFLFSGGEDKKVVAESREQTGEVEVAEDVQHPAH